MHREGKHVLSHAAIYLIARGVPGVVAFLTIPLFTRLLDPVDYGRYTLVVATVALLNALLFQWLRLSLVRYLPAYKDDAARLKSTLATAGGLMILALGVVAAIVCVLPATRVWRPVVLPCWVMLAAQATFELCCEYSRAIIKPWRYMGLQLARSTAVVAVGGALVWFGAGWWGPLAGAAAGMILGIACVWHGDWADVRVMLDRPTFLKLCHYGIPLSLTVALTIVIGTSDRFLIAYFNGEGSAGLYSAAVDFTGQTLALLMMVIQLAMFPLAVRAFEHQGRAAAQEQMKTNASLLMAVGVPCVVGIALLASGIAACFLGKEFRTTAASIMPLIALGSFLAGLKAYHFDAAFQFAHRTIYQVWIVLFAAALNVGLNLVAIPRFGINGSAVASVVAYVVSIVLTAYFGRRHFVLPFPRRESLQVLAGGGAMALVLYPVRGYHGPLAVALQISGGAAVYGGVLLALDFIGLRGTVLRKIARRSLAKARGFPVVAQSSPAPVKLAPTLVET
jgi:O-antigen/teichoic acid export membrane protein